MRIVTLSPPLVIKGREQDKFSKDSRSPAVSKGGCVYYPFWLAYATGLLEQEGHNVRLIDAPARGMSEEQAIKATVDYDPELIIVQTVTASFYNDVKITEKIKQLVPNAFVLFSGDHVTALPTESLKESPAINAVCVGEMDFTAKDLAFALEQEHDLGTVEGMVWKRQEGGKEQVVYNAPRPFASGEDLDKMPFVTKVYKKHLVIEDYFYPSVLYPEVTIWTGRGCKFRCTFCVDEQTVIAIKEQDGMKVDKISSLFNKILDEKSEKIEGYEVADVSEQEIFVLSNGKFTKILKASRIKTEKMLELKLEGGKSLKLTPDHIVPVKRDGKTIEIKAWEITQSDQIHFSKNLEFGQIETKRINLAEELIKKAPQRELKDVFVQNLGTLFEYLKTNGKAEKIKLFKNYWKQYNTLPIHEFYRLSKEIEIPEKIRNEIMVGGKNILPVPMMIEANKELMQLIGFFASEGHYSQHSLVITSSEKETQELIVNAVKKTFPKSYITISDESFGKTPQIHFGGKIASMFFRHVLGMRKLAKNKNLPALVFNVNEKLAGECLKALFSGDGGFYPSSRRISYYSISKSLIEQVGLLLTKLGINYTLKIHDQRGAAVIANYNVTINEKVLAIKISSWDDRQKFSEKIGFFGKKQEELSAYQLEHKPNRIKVLEVLLNNQLSMSQIAEATNMSNVQVRQVISRLSKENLVQKKVLSKHGFVKNVSFSATEFYRDNIKELLKVKEINQIDEEAMVYDLETENSYFDANGLVIHNCKYPQTITGHDYRARSVSNVVDELEWISKNLPQVKDIMIEDDTFTQDRERAIAICKEILARNLTVTWTVNARADVPLEVMEWMKKAGCRLMCVGFESATQEILNNIKKGTTVQKIRQFMKDTKQAKMLVHGCFMLGNKGETKATIQKTIAFAKELDPDTAQFFPLMVYPGTEAYAWARKEGYLTTQKWNEWLLPDGTHNTLISRPGLSGKELVEACDRARLEFYLRPSYIGKKIVQGLTSPTEFPRLVKSSFTFYKFLWKHLKYSIGMRQDIPGEQQQSS